MASSKSYSDENPEGNPWTFISKNEVLDSPWIAVSQHKLLNVVGREQTYNIVNFKNKAVGIVPWHGDGTITLVGQFRYATNSYSWEIPEGGCPERREPLQAAKMELAEETGLHADTYAVMMRMHLSNSVSDEWAIVYLATGLTQGDASPEENEVLQTRRISLQDLIAEIESGNITDAITVAAAYKLALMRAQGEL